MRTVTLIARTALVAATLATLGAGVSTAEARFRLRLGIGTATARTPTGIPARSPERPAAVPILAASVMVPGAALARQSDVRFATAAGAEPTQPAKPAFEFPSTTTAKAVRVAGPWCPADRIVGAGAGFCQVN